MDSWVLPVFMGFNHSRYYAVVQDLATGRSSKSCQYVLACLCCEEGGLVVSPASVPDGSSSFRNIAEGSVQSCPRYHPRPGGPSQQWWMLPEPFWSTVWVTMFSISATSVLSSFIVTLSAWQPWVPISFLILYITADEGVRAGAPFLQDHRLLAGWFWSPTPFSVLGPVTSHRAL